MWPVDRLHPPGGRVLLAAMYKVGKTSLVANYVRSRADGDDFLGEYLVSATQGVTAVLDFESTESQIDTYYGEQRIRRDDKVLIIPLRGRAAAFNLLDPNVRSRWAKRFKVAGVSNVILDCLRPLLDALGLDEHKDAGKLLVAFDAFLNEAEADDAVVVTHFGHTGERARGDSRILDWPDAIWKLTRQDDQPNSPRFLSAYGRDVDVPESQLAFDAQTRRIAFSARASWRLT